MPADLRPMTIGEVLDRMFRLYKDQFWLFAGIMSLPFIVLFVFNMGVALMQRAQPIQVPQPGTPPQFPSGETVLLGMGAGLLVLVLTFVLSGIGQAATIFAVSDLYLGRETSIRGAFRQIRGHILQVLGVIFLTGLIAVVGLILLIIPGVILMCRMAVAVPAAMLEDASPGTAISRSMDLTSGFAIQTFLIYLLTFALGMGVSLLFSVPFTIMALVPHPHLLPLGLAILQQIFVFIGQVIVAPIGAIAFCLMYYNLRVRKEAFDLEHLMNSIEPGPTASGAAPRSVLPA